jgi:PAS domain S-box-containing protein
MKKNVNRNIGFYGADKLEEQIQQKTAEFKDIFDRISDAFVALDKNWCYTYMNKRAGEIFNRDPKKMIGKHIWTEFPEGIGQPFYKAYYKAMEEQKYIHLEEYYPPYDRWFENHIYPSSNGLSIFFSDITERKKAEEELRMRDQRLSYHLTNSPLAVIEWDKNLVITKWSVQAENIFGWTESEVVGKHFDEFNLVFERDKELVARVGAQLMSGSVARNKSVNRNNTKSGNIIYCEWYNSVLKDERGKVLSIMSLVHDITENRMAEESLKANEQQLELIYNTSIDIIFLISVEAGNRYRFTSVNNAFLSATGLKKEQVVGKLVEEVIPEPSSSIVFSKYQQTIREHQILQWEETSDYPAGRKTGIVTISPVFNEFDECTMLVGTVHDITKRKEVEEELRNSELRYRSLIDQASDAIMITDQKGNFLDVNTSFCKQFGYTREELLELNVSMVIEPEQFKNDPVRFDLLVTGQAILRERRMMHKNGTIIEVEANVKMLPDGRILAIARDITERKKSEEIIQLSHRRLKEAELIGKTGYWHWDVEAGKVTWSEGTYRIFDETPGNFKENVEDFQRRIHANDKERIQKTIQQLFESKKSTSYEFWIKTPANEDRYIGTTAEAILDQKGNILSIFGNTVDLTERKRAEELLVKEKGLSDSIINSLPGIFYLYDREGKFIRWNKEFELVSGYTAEEISRMHPTDFFGTDEKDYITKRIGDVFKYGSNDAEANFITKEGKIIPFYFKAVRINYEGEPCLLGYGIDISDRKKAEEELRESEQKYKLLFDSSPLPMWMFSKTDFLIIDVNEAAVKHYGYSRDEFLQMKIKDLRPSEDIEQFLEKFSVSGQDGNYLGTWRHRKKDGTLINVEIIGHDIIYKGTLTRLVLANDVTEKIVAEEKLKHSYDEIRQLASHIENIREEEKIEIAREIHDELGQQLTGLKIDISWISKKMNQDNEVIKQKIKDTIELIDGTIKTVRRIATELRPSVLDDLGLVSALQWQSEEFGKRSGIKIEFNSTVPLITVAKNIAVAIFRIYQESLTNVLRHANATIVITAFHQEDDQFVLKVIDNGNGFDVNKVDYKKTLGLLGMKERTLMIGGKYDITSVLGKGTTVVVSVPMQ